MQEKEAVEIIPARLYYVSLRSVPSGSRPHHFFSTDTELVYWNFFLDFGPLNLSHMYRFFALLDDKLRDERYKNKTIYYYSSMHPHRRANSSLLIAAWAMVRLDLTPEQAFRGFRRTKYVPFHDASPCACTYNLSILHCLQGIRKATALQLYNFDTFDPKEYEHYGQVEHGDMNWLADGKFLAFAGPHQKSQMTADGYRTLTPDNYIPYFKKNNVSLVIRLNKKYYDAQRFRDAGIDHLDLYYLDGSVPPPRILHKFLQACEDTPGAVAVHCKAGLGRTGTCIGAYMIKHFGFTAVESIAWMRICRPGSVIGPQQHYLEDMQEALVQEGLAYRRAREERRAPGRAAAAALTSCSTEVDATAFSRLSLSTKGNNSSGGGAERTRSGQGVLPAAAAAAAAAAAVGDTAVGVPRGGRSSNGSKASSLSMESSRSSRGVAAAAGGPGSPAPPMSGRPRETTTVLEEDHLRPGRRHSTGVAKSRFEGPNAPRSSGNGRIPHSSATPRASYLSSSATSNGYSSPSSSSTSRRSSESAIHDAFRKNQGDSLRQVRFYSERAARAAEMVPTPGSLAYKLKH